jgi:hypothetical protein
MRDLTTAVSSVVQHISRPTAPIAPAPRPPLTREDFEANPQMLIDRIQEDMATQIAPINQFRAQFERRSTYESIKSQVKASYPNLARFWNHIEPGLDQTFNSGQVDVNIQMVLYQAQAILGGIALNNPTAFASTTPVGTPPTPPPSIIPPSGSPPPAPPTPASRELTPNEKIMAAQKGLTDVQYLALQSGNALVISPRSEVKK